VNALRRSLNLALEDGLISSVDKIPAPEVHNVRTGFFTEGDLNAVISELPDDLKPLVRFSALTGWRKAEILSLRWSRVDLEVGEIRLEPGTTKNDEGREISYRDLPELAELINRQPAHTDEVERQREKIVTHVFHRNGEPITCIRRAWDAACERAGLKGRWFHDLRRTAVRQMERAGVPRTTAMKITGHKTESVYRRYAITDKESIAEGMKKIHEFRQQQAEDRSVVPFRKEA
jgi:integrase